MARPKRPRTPKPPDKPRNRYDYAGHKTIFLRCPDDLYAGLRTLQTQTEGVTGGQVGLGTIINLLLRQHPGVQELLRRQALEHGSPAPEAPPLVSPAEALEQIQAQMQQEPPLEPTAP